VGYRVHLEGRSSAGVSNADIEQLERLLGDLSCVFRAGKASADGYWSALLKWSGRGGRRGRKADEIMARLDDETKQEAQSNFALWWSADLEVTAPGVESAREAAVSRMLDAFHGSGRTQWTVSHSEVAMRRWYGAESEVRTGPHPFPKF
jgi:hypothetical protein